MNFESNRNQETLTAFYANPKFQNKEIMSEALKCIIVFGFNELKLDKIEAFTHNKNESSKKLLEKNAFHFMEYIKDQDTDFNRIDEL